MVRRTSVFEETHPRLFKSLQAILESIHSNCIQCQRTLIQTVPSVDQSLGEKGPSHFQFGSVFDQLVFMTSEMLGGR